MRSANASGSAGAMGQLVGGACDPKRAMQELGTSFETPVSRYGLALHLMRKLNAHAECSGQRPCQPTIGHVGGHAETNAELSGDVTTQLSMHCVRGVAGKRQEIHERIRCVGADTGHKGGWEQFASKN